MNTNQTAIEGHLQILNSKADIYGNRYWAFVYTDNASGNQVKGLISGGESNIDCIRHDWNGKNTGWNRGIVVSREEMKIREFNRHTKKWRYAGCRPEEIRNYIKDSLKTIEISQKFLNMIPQTTA